MSKLSSNVRQLSVTPAQTSESGGRPVTRQRPPDHLPRDVLARADFAQACAERDVGAIFTLAIRWGGVGFTPSHVARRCEMSVGRVQDYMKGRIQHAQSVEVFERIADGLHISGRMLELSRRSWERFDAEPRLPTYTDVARGNGSSLSLSGREWTNDDAARLSEGFDSALASASPADVKQLSHEWLISDPPQQIQLASGRKIGDALIATTEHRVIQLRRADDFISGRDSHDLVLKELRATADLVREASCTEPQARRLLTAIGELAQLAGWVTADAGSYREAERYLAGGIGAAHAANDKPLAANLISTLSYQMANAGKSSNAVLLARTAYAGAPDATATTKALLLERVAWAEARSGDLKSCERSLGQVEEQFSRSEPDRDPDWVYWLSPDEINIMAGRCYTELKQPRRAESLLVEATSHYDSSHARERSLYLSWLAEDYIQLNELEHATQTARQVLALTAHANSARSDARLERLTSMLEKHRGVFTIDEFLESCKDVLDSL